MHLKGRKSLTKSSMHFSYIHNCTEIRDKQPLGQKSQKGQTDPNNSCTALPNMSISLAWNFPIYKICHCQEKNFTDTAVPVQQEHGVFQKELLGLGFKEVKLALFLLPALKKKGREALPGTKTKWQWEAHSHTADIYINLVLERASWRGPKQSWGPVLRVILLAL